LEEAIRIDLEGLRGEESIAELCHPAPRPKPRHKLTMGSDHSIGVGQNCPLDLILNSGTYLRSPPGSFFAIGLS
jgi:hypothetical protein